eukprot:2566629-Lingulodinium_polyedra.AAC.1
MGGGIAPYGPLQPDTWEHLTTQAGIWARLSVGLAARRHRISTAAAERVGRPGNEHTERCVICLVDIDPSEDPCRWPHCAHPMHTDCNAALHAAQDPPRCPACRIDQN